MPIDPHARISREQIQAILKDRTVFKTDMAYPANQIANHVCGLENAPDLLVHPEFAAVLANLGTRLCALATKAAGRTVTIYVRPAELDAPHDALGPEYLPSLGQNGEVSWEFGRPRDLLDKDAGLTAD